jgi:hypothetical protein
MAKRPDASGHPIIFRADVLLPYVLAVPAGNPVPPVTFRHRPYRVTVFAPVESVNHAAARRGDRPSAVGTACAAPAAEQDPDPDTTINGAPTIRGDLLPLAFARHRFNRREHGTPGPSQEFDELGDPSPRAILEATNRWLVALRSMGRLAHIVPLRLDELVYWGAYLRDTGEQPRRREGFIRAKGFSVASLDAIAVSTSLWEETGRLISSYKPAASDALLLDAAAALPAVAPTVTLAYAGLETYLDVALGRLPTARRLPPGYWQWQTDRRRSPDPTEQLDSFLFVLCGRSLKVEDPKLWDDYLDLDKARNSLVHSGTAVDRAGKEVNPNRATALVRSAQAIIEWVEMLLPAADRVARYSGKDDLQIRKRIR